MCKCDGRRKINSTIYIHIINPSSQTIAPRKIICKRISGLKTIRCMPVCCQDLRCKCIATQNRTRAIKSKLIFARQIRHSSRANLTHKNPLLRSYRWAKQLCNSKLRLYHIKVSIPLNITIEPLRS